jgi:hypothetical protein
MKYLICSFSVFLILLSMPCCNNENLDKNNYSPSALSFKAIAPSDDLRSSVPETGMPKVDTILILSGKDIAWFNGITGELKFNDNFSGLVMSYNASVHVYSDKSFLFNLMLACPYMSLVYNTPVLYGKMKEEGGGLYIQSGYPNWDMELYPKGDPIRIEREKNWKNLVESEGWKLFIVQLKKENRYRE